MSATTKLPHPVVLPTALRLADALRPYCRRIEAAGSLRRETPTVGDIEIVAIPRRPADLFGNDLPGEPTALDRFLAERHVTLTKNGPRYKQFTYGRHQVDLFLPTPATWGSVFTIRTGPWEFSRWLVTSKAAGGAAPSGLVFRDGRLYVGGRPLLTPEESDVFAALGLAYIPPAERFGPVAAPLQIDPIWNYE